MGKPTASANFPNTPKDRRIVPISERIKMLATISSTAGLAVSEG